MKLEKLLQKKNIEYEEGLNKDEIVKIETIYNIEFPPDLKKTYMDVLPIGTGFYNWRDFSEENIEYINQIINLPFVEIEEDLEYVEWGDDWGEEPVESERREDIIRNKMLSAPKLIPIYSHRYIASGNMELTPIFSVHGTDIIYYGENLEQYFQIEFGDKEDSDLDYKNIQYVPFWSDIL